MWPWSIPPKGRLVWSVRGLPGCVSLVGTGVWKRRSRPEAGGSVRYSAHRELVQPTEVLGSYWQVHPSSGLPLAHPDCRAPLGHSGQVYHPSTEAFSVQPAVSNMFYARTLPLWLPTATRLKTGAWGWLWACNLLSSSILCLPRFQPIQGGCAPLLYTDTCHLQPKHAWAIGAVSWVMAILSAAPHAFSYQRQPNRRGAAATTISMPLSST